MPPKIPRFITASAATTGTASSGGGDGGGDHHTLTPAVRRSAPKFVSALPPPSHPATRPVFPAPVHSDSIDSDTDSPLHARTRRWEYNSDPDSDDEALSAPTSPTDSLPSPTQNRSLPLPFTPARPAPASGTPVTSLLRALRAPTPGPERPVDWSPSKRRAPGRYIGDGLAATVAGWVLETRNAQGRREGTVVDAGAVTEEEGYVAVLGREGEGLLLVKGRGEMTVGVGTKVKIEWPWWEVETAEGRWRVCVFWSVVREEEEQEEEQEEDEMLF